MATVSPDAVAQVQIRSFFDRWERLEGEKTAISEDLKELFAEAKGNGFDTKVLRKLFRDSKTDHADRSEFEALYDLYAAALGMGLATPAHPAPGDDEPDHDAETGEIIEPQAQPVQTGPRFGSPTTNAGAVAVEAPAINSDGVGNADAILRSGREEASRLAHNQEIAGSSPAPATSSTAVRKDAPLTTPADGSADSLTVEPNNAVTHLREGTGPLGAGTQAPPVETHPQHEAEEAGEDVVTAASSPDTQSASPDPESAADDGESRVAPAALAVTSNVTQLRTHNPATHFLNSDGLARLHGCLKPELCGSGQPRVKLCFNCSVKHDGPTPQVEAG